MKRYRTYYDAHDRMLCRMDTETGEFCGPDGARMKKPQDIVIDGWMADGGHIEESDTPVSGKVYPIEENVPMTGEGVRPIIPGEDPNGDEEEETAGKNPAQENSAPEQEDEEDDDDDCGSTPPPGLDEFEYIDWVMSH